MVPSILCDNLVPTHCVMIIPFDLEVQGLGVRTNFLLKKNSLPSVRLQDCMKIYLTLL